jgi:hypothetical protein
MVYELLLFHLKEKHQQTSLNGNTGYSEKAQRTGNTPAYLPPNSQSMQKTYRAGLSEKIEDRSPIGVFLNY